MSCILMITNYRYLFGSLLVTFMVSQRAYKIKSDLGTCWQEEERENRVLNWFCNQRTPSYSQW